MMFILLALFVFNSAFSEVYSAGCNGTTGPNVIPGGSLSADSCPNFYGNDIFLREFLPYGGKKSWLDIHFKLPAGRLTTFFINIYNLSMPAGSTKSTRLQIWRPADAKNYVYKLIWDYRVEVMTDNSVGLLYRFDIEENPQIIVAKNDLIGWTNEEELGPISMNYIDGHMTYFRKVQDNDFPIVGENYTFDNIYLPSIFSVGVLIDEAWCGDVVPGCRSCINGTECQECSEGFYLDVIDSSCQNITSRNIDVEEDVSFKWYWLSPLLVLPFVIAGLAFWKGKKSRPADPIPPEARVKRTAES